MHGTMNLKFSKLHILLRNMKIFSFLLLLYFHIDISLDLNQQVFL